MYNGAEMVTVLTGMGILEGEEASREGIDRFVRGRGRRNVDQNGVVFVSEVVADVSPAFASAMLLRD